MGACHKRGFSNPTRELLDWNLLRGRAQEPAFCRFPGDLGMEEHQSAESSLRPPTEQLRGPQRANMLSKAHPK